MKYVLFLLFPFLFTRADGRMLRLTVSPVVPGVELHSFTGLKETIKQYALRQGRATIPVPVRDGLVIISLPSGQEFPLWVAPADTGYTMYLSPASPTPQVTGSAASQQLYAGMAVAAKLQLRRTVLTKTRIGLPDTSRLAHIIAEAQATLQTETDSLYRNLQLHMAGVPNVLLWGNYILPTEVARLTKEGMEAVAKSNILSFVKAHYGLAEKSNLLQNLIGQYLLATEAARIRPGEPSFENRTRADLAAWTAALNGKCTSSALNNYFINYFLRRNMWTLCDTLMRDNPVASCPAPAGVGAGQPGKDIWWNAMGDSLNAGHGNVPVLLALYDIDCPAAVAEYILFRRQLKEGYSPTLRTCVALLHQADTSFASVWDGMPPAIYHSTAKGYGTVAAMLPKNATLPSYWQLAAGHLQYIGRSYHDVKSYFSKKQAGKKQ